MNKVEKSDLYVFIILALMLIVLIINSTVGFNDFVFNLLMSSGLTLAIYIIYDYKIKNREIKQ